MCKFSKVKKLISVLILFVFTAFIIAIMPGAKNESSSAEDRTILLPIIMYHSVLKDINMRNDYTISPELFENDLKYLTQNGYTTITVKDLIGFIYHDKELPDKCIMLTFDDGYYNNYYYAYPLLKKYNCKAVISPIASATQKFSESGEISVTYGNISVDNIKEMVSSGCIEIQNHSYDMHKLTPRNGIMQKRGESKEAYEKALSKDIIMAQDYFKNSANVNPKCFVYPFGARSDDALNIIKKLGFICTMTCTEKTNIISKEPDSLFELGRYRRKPDESIKSLLGRIITTD